MDNISIRMDSGWRSEYIYIRHIVSVDTSAKWVEIVTTDGKLHTYMLKTEQEAARLQRLLQGNVKHKFNVE